MPPNPYILMLCHIAKFKINRIILNTRPRQIQWSWIYLWIQWPRVYYCSFISSLPGPKIPWADFGVWPRHEGQDHLPACSSCFHTKGWFLMGVANWWVQIKHEWNTTSWFLNFMLGTWWLSNTGRKSLTSTWHRANGLRQVSAWTLMMMKTHVTMMSNPSPNLRSSIDGWMRMPRSQWFPKTHPGVSHVVGHHAVEAQYGYCFFTCWIPTNKFVRFHLV